MILCTLENLYVVLLIRASQRVGSMFAFSNYKKMSEVPVGAPTVMAHGRLQMYS